MSTNKSSKIKILFTHFQFGTIGLAKWLEGLGISRNLQQRYLKTGWLEAIGSGAFKRPGENVTWQGGLKAIQEQTRLSIHAGALTALSLQSSGQHFGVAEETILLFSPLNTIIPRWFANHKWSHPLNHIKTSIIPESIGLNTHRDGNHSIIVSTPERALMECLHLAPAKMDLVECYQLMQNRPQLRPRLIQELLEKCNSVKVKRLFLYMATKANHQWLKSIDQTQIDLGTGDRSITSKGIYDQSFRISIPKELVDESSNDRAKAVKRFAEQHSKLNLSNERPKKQFKRRRLS